jgi:hypothetical protein
MSTTYLQLTVIRKINDLRRNRGQNVNFSMSQNFS